MAVDVKHFIEKHKKLKAEKTVWNTHWQLISEYIMTRKSDFMQMFQPGEFLNQELFDSTAPKVNNIMSASLLAMLWPDGANSFRFNPPQEIPDTQEIREYFKQAHIQMSNVMDDDEAGLITALEEYMRDQGAFGTSGIAVFENVAGDSVLLYTAWDVKSMSIIEGANGKVNGVYYETEITIQRAVEDFGLENLSENTKERFQRGETEKKIKILHVIEPRIGRDIKKEGSQDMPFISIHIEVTQKHPIRESGFIDFPVPIARFTKVIKEKYGRSPGMAALPDILEINSIREAEIVAIEKQLDPPLGVLHDGVLGGGTLDTSPGAVNVLNVRGRVTGRENPIFPLFTVGDMAPTDKRIEELKQSISDHFFIDRLLDLNNEVRMTLGEAQIRNKLRGFTLGSLFSRQTVELFTPLIKRTFNLLFAKGLLGVIRGTEQEAEVLARGEFPLYIPDALVQLMTAGKEVYKIEYLTPAQRTTQAEEAAGIIQSWQFANEVAAARPEVYDNYDEDFSARRLSETAGAPQGMLRSIQLRDKIREERQQAQKEQEQLAKEMAGTQALKNVTPALKMGLMPTSGEDIK